jgi:hypothetical protein
LIALEWALKFSVMTLDGRMFYFTSSAIRQILNVFLIWVTQTLVVYRLIFLLLFYVEMDEKGIQEKAGKETKALKKKRDKG